MIISTIKLKKVKNPLEKDNILKGLWKKKLKIIQ